jgi:hypothetical protein
LRTAIAQDHAAGLKPACVIGTAGTVNTGAIDDLQALAAIAVEEDFWFHVDGCIGALIAIAPRNAYRVAGIERAGSVAVDPHKWLHALFEAGCALVRDASAHQAAFTVTPEYLDTTPRGLASGHWLHDATAAFGYRVLERQEAFVDVPGGDRLWSLDNELDFSAGQLPATSASGDETWVDPLIGLRGIWSSAQTCSFRPLQT